MDDVPSGAVRLTSYKNGENAAIRESNHSLWMLSQMFSWCLSQVHSLINKKWLARGFLPDSVCDGDVGASTSLVPSGGFSQTHLYHPMPHLSTISHFLCRDLVVDICEELLKPPLAASE